MSELRKRQLRGTAALAGREVRRIFALWTQTILPPVVTALLFLAVFGGALGARIRAIEGLDYASFVIPGLLVMTVVGQAFGNSSTSLFQAKNEGYVEDLLTSPLAPWQLALGYLTGGVVRGLVAAAAVAAVALPVAWEGGGDVGLAILALVAGALVFATIGVITGLWAETFDQHSFVNSIVITPLALLGGVFYSADALDEPWATLTRIDPLYYLVDATRGGLTGFHESPIWLSLLVAVVAAAAAFTTATALIGRGWRLKP